MKRHIGRAVRSVLSFALVFSLSTPSFAGGADEAQPAAAAAARKAAVRAGKAPAAEPTGEVLVAYKPGKKADAVRSAKARGASVARSTDFAKFFVVKTPKGVSDKAFAARFSKDADVRYAEPVVTRHATAIPTDPLYPMQWNMKRVGAEAAWDVTRGSAEVTVAVVDSGVQVDHPDLANQLNTADAWDFVDNDSIPQDAYGHGTHVAGIIAAESDNATGVAGLASECTVLPVRVLDDAGNGTTDAEAAGIIWAADKGAKVINLSLAGMGTSQAEQEAIAYAASKGVVVVAAAGNEGAYPADFPARYPSVIAVGSTAQGIDDTDNPLSAFSNYGPQIDLVAPGEPVVSTYPTASASSIEDPGYQVMSGTSMAAPHVAASAALLVSANPGWSAAQVEATLKATAKDLGPTGRDDAFGWGLIQIDSALTTTTAFPELPSIGDDNIPGLALPASPVAGDLDELYDNNDVFAVELKRGESFEATMSLSPAGDGTFAASLFAYKPGALDVDIDIDYAGFSEEALDASPQTMKFTAAADGTYYIDAFNSYGIGTYELEWAVVPLLTKLTAVPAAPDGTNGWFKTAPTITLTNEDAATIYFGWDTPATEAYSASIKPPGQGTQVLNYYAVDAMDNAETSRTATFKVDTQPPGKPVLNTPTGTHNSVALSWSPVGDSTSGLSHYEVWRNNQKRSTLPVGTSYTDTGLVPGTKYTYEIKAVDKAGLSASSGLQSVTTNSLTVSGPAKVAYGSAAKITANAKSNAVAASVNVQLQKSTNGTSWSYVGSPKPTDASGNAVFSTELKPLRKTWYRAIATIGTATVTTPPKYVTVDPYLTVSAPLDVVRTTSTTKYYFTVSGSLKPLHAVGRPDVSVGFYQDGKWVKTVKGTVTDTNGTWSVKTTLSTKGTYTYKAWVGGYSDSAGAVHNGYTTPSKKLYVNRPKLSIYANRTNITYSTPATIYGYLKRRSGSAMSGRTVYLERSSNGTSGWSTYKTLKTTSTGKVSYTVKPEKVTYYRFRFPGETYHMSRTTTVKKITPIKYTDSKTFAGSSDPAKQFKEMTTPYALELPKGWHRVKVSATRGIAWTAVGINGRSTAVAWWDDNLSSGTTGTFKFYAKEKALYFIQVGNSSSGKINGNTLWWELW